MKEDVQSRRKDQTANIKKNGKDVVSPLIEIDYSQVLTIEEKDLKWHGYERMPQMMTLSNTSSSILISGRWNKRKPFITGGPLNGSYVFSQIHFHLPSEHEIDGERYPLEMHAVHYKSSYSTQDKAMLEKDGTLVIVYLFQRSESGSTFLPEIIRLMPQLRVVNTRITADPKPLEQIMIPFNSNYLLYWGPIVSSTTSYMLQWIICLTLLPVSGQQLKDLKDILYFEKSDWLVAKRFPPEENKVFHIVPYERIQTHIEEMIYTAGHIRRKSASNIALYDSKELGLTMQDPNLASSSVMSQHGENFTGVLESDASLTKDSIWGESTTTQHSFSPSLIANASFEQKPEDEPIYDVTEQIDKTFDDRLIHDDKKFDEGSIHDLIERIDKKSVDGSRRGTIEKDEEQMTTIQDNTDMQKEYEIEVEEEDSNEVKSTNVYVVTTSNSENPMQRARTPDDRRPSIFGSSTQETFPARRNSTQLETFPARRNSLQQEKPVVGKKLSLQETFPTTKSFFHQEAPRVGRKSSQQGASQGGIRSPKGRSASVGKRSSQQESPSVSKKSSQEESPTVGLKFRQTRSPSVGKRSSLEQASFVMKKSSQESVPSIEKKSSLDSASFIIQKPSQEKAPSVGENSSLDSASFIIQKPSQDKAPSVGDKSSLDSASFIIQKPSQEQTPSVGRKPSQEASPIIGLKSPQTRIPSVGKKSSQEQATSVGKKSSQEESPTVGLKSPQTRIPSVGKKSSQEQAPSVVKKSSITKTPPVSKKPSLEKTPLAAKKLSGQQTPPLKRNSSQEHAPSVVKKSSITKTPPASKKPSLEKTPIVTKKLSGQITPPLKKNSSQEKSPTVAKKSLLPGSPPGAKKLSGQKTPPPARRNLSQEESPAAAKKSSGQASPPVAKTFPGQKTSPLKKNYSQEESPTIGRKSSVPTSPTVGRRPSGPTSPPDGKKSSGPTSPTVGRRPSTPTSPTVGRKPSTPTSPTVGRKPSTPTSPTVGRKPSTPTSPTVGRRPSGPTSPPDFKKTSGPTSPSTAKKFSGQKTPPIKKPSQEVSPTVGKKSPQQESSLVAKKLSGQKTPPIRKNLSQEESPTIGKKPLQPKPLPARKNTSQPDSLPIKSYSLQEPSHGVSFSKESEPKPKIENSSSRNRSTSRARSVDEEMFISPLRRRNTKMVSQAADHFQDINTIQARQDLSPQLSIGSQEFKISSEDYIAKESMNKIESQDGAHTKRIKKLSFDLMDRLSDKSEEDARKFSTSQKKDVWAELLDQVASKDASNVQDRIERLSVLDPVQDLEICTMKIEYSRLIDMGEGIVTTKDIPPTEYHFLCDRIEKDIVTGLKILVGKFQEIKGRNPEEEPGALLEVEGSYVYVSPMKDYVCNLLNRDDFSSGSDESFKVNEEMSIPTFNQEFFISSISEFDDSQDAPTLLDSFYRDSSEALLQRKSTRRVAKISVDFNINSERDRRRSIENSELPTAVRAFKARYIEIPQVNKTIKPEKNDRSSFNKNEARDSTALSNYSVKSDVNKSEERSRETSLSARERSPSMRERSSSAGKNYKVMYIPCLDYFVPTKL